MPTTLENPAQLRPTSTPGMEDEEYLVFENVPIFDEHEGDDGVAYDRHLLEAIASNCNRRIEDTGDWCPLVLGHTADAKGNPVTPPIAGFAGPFHVDTLGNVNPRACIYAKFWVRKDHEQDFRNNPRRSVEVWPEERPEDRYFDPIALLGAETPKRDLGILYRRSRSDMQPQRYEAAAPSGTNTFIPGGTNRTADKPLEYQERPEMSNEDLVQQVVAALMPMVDAKIAEAMAAPPDPEPPAPEVPAEALAPVDEDFEADAEYGKVLSDSSMKYMGEDGEIDAEGLEGHLDTFDDDDKQHYAAYAGASEDESVKTMYSKANSYFTKSSQAEPAPTDDDAKPAEKDGSVQRYRKENADLKLHNQKLQSANRKLIARDDRLTAELAEAKKAARYSKRREALASLVTDGFMIDVDDEMDLVADFSDAQFSRHVEDVIPTRYSKFNTLTQTLGQGDVPADPRTQKKETDSQKYAKRASELVQKAREAGVPEGSPETRFEHVLEQLVKHNGKMPELNGAAA